MAKFITYNEFYKEYPQISEVGGYPKTNQFMTMTGLINMFINNNQYEIVWKIPIMGAQLITAEDFTLKSKIEYINFTGTQLD